MRKLILITAIAIMSASPCRAGLSLASYSPSSSVIELPKLDAREAVPAPVEQPMSAASEAVPAEVAQPRSTEPEAQPAATEAQPAAVARAKSNAPQARPVSVAKSPRVSRPRRHFPTGFAPIRAFSAPVRSFYHHCL